MKQQKYDIFISYRRDAGRQYARTLQLMLEKKGYKVFLDYDELVDAKFSPQIEAAIKNSKIFLIILTKDSMSGCAHEGDWVRREIEIAIENGNRIVPINPDGTYNGMSEGVPEHIKNTISETQHSDINFGQALNAMVDLMVKNRIKPFIHHRHHTYIYFALAIIVILLTIGFISFGLHWKNNREFRELKDSSQFKGQTVKWDDDITKEQVLAINEIFKQLQFVEGGEFIQGAKPLSDGTYHKNVQTEFEIPAHKVSVGSFYISKFEVTTGQWNALMNDTREGDSNLPVGNITFTQAKEFTERLTNLTNMDFRLPTESEWEYAAKGGAAPEGFMFAGSDNPKKVAWYANNFGGSCHSDLPEEPTNKDLFNMSGNLSEWCDTDFSPYDENQPAFGEGCKVIRGGNYDSPEYGITVTHREPCKPDTSIPTLGFRIVLSR